MSEVKEKGSKIVKNEEVLGGKPRIEGRRVGVVDVVELYSELDYNSERIATELDLRIEQVFSALQYFYEHPNEIREEMKKRRNYSKDS